MLRGCHNNKTFLYILKQLILHRVTSISAYIKNLFRFFSFFSSRKFSFILRDAGGGGGREILSHHSPLDTAKVLHISSSCGEK